MDAIETQLQHPDPESRKLALYRILSDRRTDLLPALKDFALQEPLEDLALLGTQIWLALENTPRNPVRERKIQDLLDHSGNLASFEPEDWSMLASSGPKTLLVSICQAMGSRPPSEAGELLEACLLHPDWEVRREAIFPALFNPNPFIFCLGLSLLNDASESVARTVMQTLQRIPGLDLGLVIERGFRHQDLWVKSMLSAYLPQLVREDLRQTLLRLQSSPDPVISAAVTQSLAELERQSQPSEPEPFPTPPSLAPVPPPLANSYSPIPRQAIVSETLFFQEDPAPVQAEPFFPIHDQSPISPPGAPLTPSIPEPAPPVSRRGSEPRVISMKSKLAGGPTAPPEPPPAPTIDLAAAHTAMQADRQPAHPPVPSKPTQLTVPIPPAPPPAPPKVQPPAPISPSVPATSPDSLRQLPRSNVVDSILSRYPTFLTQPFCALFEPASNAQHHANLKRTVESLIAYLNFCFLQSYLFFANRNPKTDQVVKECLQTHLVGPASLRYLNLFSMALREIQGKDSFFCFPLSRTFTEPAEANPLFPLKDLLLFVSQQPNDADEQLPGAAEAMTGALVGFKGLLNNRLVFRTPPGGREPFFDLSGPTPQPLGTSQRPLLDLPSSEIIVLSRDRSEALGLFPYFTFDGRGIQFSQPDPEKFRILLERLEISLDTPGGGPKAS